MKKLSFFLKNLSLCVTIIILWQQSSFCTVRPDEITTVTLPSEATGIIPEDILYIEEYNRFYVFGNNKLVILEYDNINLIYEVTGHMDLFTENEPIEVNTFGTNIFPKFEVTLNTPPPNKYLAYDENNDKLYVLRPDFKIVQINVSTNELEGVKISCDQNFMPYSFDQSKICFKNGKIFWKQDGMQSSLKKHFFGIYEIENNFQQIISNPYFSEFNYINDFIPDENFVYVIINIDNSHKIQKRTISSTFGSIDEITNTDIKNGKIFYNPSHNRIYCYGLGTSKVYSVSPDNMSYIIIDNGNSQITCATYDNINNLLYLGTNANINDILIYRYNPENPEYQFVKQLATNFPHSNNEWNKPYYLYCHNEKVYISKESEVVRINYFNSFGEDHFTYQQILRKLKNYFYGCAYDTQHDNILVANLEGMVHQINSNGDYVASGDLQVGIKVNDACHIPFTNVVCLYTRDLIEDNHLIFYNTQSNEIVQDIISEFPVSDVVFNPITSEIIVSYYSESVNYINCYSADLPGTPNQHTLDGYFCGKLFIDPQGKLYCALGLDNINHAKIEILNANNPNYSHINSLSIQGISNLTNFTVSFTYHEPNSFIYGTVMAEGPESRYSDIFAINPQGVGTLAHLTSQFDLPVKIESCQNHNKLYVQYLKERSITSIQIDNGTYTYRSLSNFSPNNDKNILDIVYDKYKDFLYLTMDGAIGLVSCELDEYDIERFFDTDLPFTHLVFNKKNKFLYAYYSEDLNTRASHMISVEPNYFQQDPQPLLLNNIVNRSFANVYDNTIAIDEYKNYVYIPNGAQCNFNIVYCTPERRYLGQGIPNYSPPNNYNYVSFPSLERVANGHVDTEPFLEQGFVPDYHNLNIILEGRVQNSSQIINKEFHPGTGWSGNLNEIYSSVGYALNHDVPSGEVGYIQMEGTRLNPGYEQLPLYSGENIENWTGYFVDETQHIFNALGDVKNDLTLITAQCWSCSVRFWMEEPPTGPVWGCYGVPENPSIPVGFVSYATMVRIKSNVNRTFAWSSNQEPYPIRTKSTPEHYCFDNNSIYTPIFVEIDTTSRPLEIGAFIGDTCIGATTVAMDDTIVMVPAYNKGDTNSIIEFEEYYGDLKSLKKQRIKNYKSYNPKIKRLTDQTIRICKPVNGAYFVSFKKEEIFEEQTNGNNLICYPNPYHSGSITVTNYLDCPSNVQIEIYDFTSKLLVDYELGNQPTGPFNFIIDDPEVISKFTPGAYYIQMKTRDSAYNAKLIVQ